MIAISQHLTRSSQGHSQGDEKEREAGTPRVAGEEGLVGSNVDGIVDGA